MTKRSFLISAFILIAAVSLGMNLCYYNQQGLPGQLNTKKANEQSSPANTTGAPAGEPSSSPNNSAAGGSGAEISTGGDPLQAAIEQKYIDRLQSIGSGYEARINSLLSSAVIEYQAAREDDPNADVSALAEQYLSAGRALEAECDAKMYAILGEFESELRANSLPVAAAFRARSTYEAEKSSRAGQILSIKP